MKAPVYYPANDNFDDLLKTMSDHRECDFCLASVICWADGDGDITVAMEGTEDDLDELLKFCTNELREYHDA